MSRPLKATSKALNAATFPHYRLASCPRRRGTVYCPVTGRTLDITVIGIVRLPADMRSSTEAYPTASHS